MPKDHPGAVGSSETVSPVVAGLTMSESRPTCSDTFPPSHLKFNDANASGGRSVPAAPSERKPGRDVERVDAGLPGGLRRWTEEEGVIVDSRTLGALQREKLARSVWQANRDAMDAPHWFGLPTTGGEERELPLAFGIRVSDAGSISGLGVMKHGKGRSAQAKGSVITFPRSGEGTHAAIVPHRTREAVLPFRAPAVKRAIVIFSLIGGAGGTSLAATLTRMLANCGERVLLADAGGHSLLPQYFGGHGSQQGVIRKFAANDGSHNEAVSMVSLDIETYAGIDEEQARILYEFNKEGALVDRVVWDLGNAPIDWATRVMQQGVRVIVPLVPTARCLLQLPAIERIFEKLSAQQDAGRWQYVLNQFDDKDPAHVDIRARLRRQLGSRLLPFMLRSSPLVDEALLNGRTIVDHAPACPLVMDLWRLVRSVAGLPQAYPEIVPGAWEENRDD